MVRISDNGPSWKWGKTAFVGQPHDKNNSPWHVQCRYCKTLYTLHQISGMLFSWNFTFQKQCNIILSLKPHRSKSKLTMREKESYHLKTLPAHEITPPSSPLSPNKSMRYTNPVFFNPVTLIQITAGGISKSPQMTFTNDVGSFRRKAPLWMLDRILNATLLNNLL